MNKNEKKIKATLFWWEKKVIYDSESIAWWLALMKNSEKHQESEKLKKNQIWTLLLNASELFIDEQKLIEQNETNNSEKIFTEKNENWHEIIF